MTKNLDLKKKIFELEKRHADEISNLTNKYEKQILALEGKLAANKLQDKYEFIKELGIYKSKESGHYFCTSCLNIAKSTVNQAIIELENDIDLPSITKKTTSPPKTKSGDIYNWYEKPLGKIAIGVIIFVLGLITVWVINHYFPFINL